jgi:hypothetical protein
MIGGWRARDPLRVADIYAAKPRHEVVATRGKRYERQHSTDERFRPALFLVLLELEDVL